VIDLFNLEGKKLIINTEFELYIEVYIIAENETYFAIEKKEYILLIPKNRIKEIKIYKQELENELS